MSVSISRNGVEIDGKVLPLISGEAHYWRHERKDWAAVLDGVVEMGFKFICTYIPWSVHEIEKGRFDFGDTDPRKDVGAFVDMAGERGLFVLVRPGPHINSELTFFGYPERILRREELLMRTSSDTPAIIPAPPRFFPAPSYASEDFYSEVAVYFDALRPILEPRTHPNGPIVGVQADNEMSFFFRTSPFDVDYSAPAIGLFRRFLRDKYEGEIDALNRAHRSNHKDFDRVMPPRRYEPCEMSALPWHFDWCAFKEFYLYYGIKRIADMLRARGLSEAFFFHNFPGGQSSSPFHIPMTETAVDAAGIDLYESRKNYPLIRDSVRLAAGTSRLPFSPEFGSGIWPWWKPLFLKDQEFATRAALMNGLKAVNFYMIADRDRWYGAPMARDGSARPSRFRFYANLNRFIRDTRFNEFSMRNDVLLLSVREYERFEQIVSLAHPVEAGLLGGVPRDWLTDPKPPAGMREPVGMLYRRQWRAMMMGFTQAGFPPALADSSVDLYVLDKFPVVAAPSFEFMSMALQRNLLVYALKGGVLVLGPRIPVFDEKMRRDTKFTSHMHEPVGYRDRMQVGGMIFERVDLFNPKRPFLSEGQDVCSYISPTEKGSIIHLGFMFQDYTGYDRSPGLAAIMKRIAAVAGLKARYTSSDPLIETALHERGPDRLLFVANPTGEPRSAAVSLGDNETLSDADTGELAAGPAAKINLPEYSVRIFNIHGAAAAKV
ncbi:MAG TPA: beta-galactosidase [bacterium]|nr:MAG: Beta-galactosidase precursor [bacterium ADurb.Bin236]HPI75176.1 beta-galactosidase [bacterium]HPN94660.1 beta-galactosidase [bacterium]